MRVVVERRNVSSKLGFSIPAAVARRLESSATIPTTATIRTFASPALDRAGPSAANPTDKAQRLRETPGAFCGMVGSNGDEVAQR